MGLAYLTRRVTFAAAHRYYREEWSEERNTATFGDCARPHGHGHNYVLEATVEGEINPETGFCVSLDDLDRVLRTEIVGRLDHRHINHDVPEFGPDGAVPTTENLLAWAWPRIDTALAAPARLHRLRLREDDTLFVDYFGGRPGTPP